MRQEPFSIFTIHLPVKRSFQWRVLLILVASYFLGNLAAIPLLRATNMPIEPVWFWGVATLVAALVLGISMLLANRTGLGAPFLEGRLQKEDISAWLRSGMALTVLICVLGLPLSLLLNLNVNSARYPAGYQLVLASVKAGVVEELFARFFLISLFVWLGSFFKRSHDGRPTRGVYWGAILLAGLIFGWGHIGATLGNLVMILSTFLGICFGWLFWKLGIEWAIFAHFAYDALVSAVLLKIYLLNNILVWIGFLSLVILAAGISWRELRRNGLETRMR
ncbi:MAG TPA: CPBP family intramembrane glutamic endopeptidase [Sedimentisphaerales bacterium]|nr:CPBP family intramembrane glutamic endopeptidase [Sedimentisphaerales bacterium]